MNIDSKFDWLEIANRLVYINGPFEKELMKLIKIHHIYIDTIGNIECVITDKYDELSNDIDNKSSVISCEKMEKIIFYGKKKFKVNYKVNYRVLDIILYNVDIDISQIQDFSNNTSVEMPKNFLHSLSMTKDIKIPETLFIFHQTNTIFILYSRTCISRTKKNHNYVVQTKKNREEILK
jgi:hypothetical protein